jgi:hypothetical protein
MTQSLFSIAANVLFVGEHLFLAGVCRNGTPSSRRTVPQSCVDARSAEIGRHDHFDRFREDVELTQTRQSPTRHIVRLE